VAGLLFFLAAFIGVARCAAEDDCEVFFSSRGIAPSVKTPQEAAEAAKKVQRDASDVETLMYLLDYYQCHAKDPELQVARTKVILWAIQNHPDLHFTGGHDDRDLFINPDDKEAYQQARRLWLEQVERYPYFPDVLRNAAQRLSLTDRAKAAEWLEGMGDYGRPYLSEVYADAITGVTGETPFRRITTVDRAQRDSAFAKYALEESGKDKELAAQVGWELHLISNAFRVEKVDSADFDPLAERLLLKSAELIYPKPVGVSYLAPFYQSQTLKPIERQVVCKAMMLRVEPDEQAARLVSGPAKVRIARTLQASLSEPVRVTADIVVGVDGHVWEAIPTSGAPDPVTQAVVGAIRNLFTYRPLKVDGQTVRVATSVEVTVEPR
jgi:hypothetical protein